MDISINLPSKVLMSALNKSSSQRGPLRSQQGKPNRIHVTLSIREDVELPQTKIAWRPVRLGANRTQIDDDVKTAELYKKVRGVLNKLTSEKFEKLLHQVRALSIDNLERLQGVIDLVFEHAVSDPNVAVVCARMCKELAFMQLPFNTKSNNKDEPQYVNFRMLLITRCQIEFEGNSVDENARDLKLKEIEKCTDPEKKKELQLVLEEEDRRMRVKSLGNIRFIGELFKQMMLSVKIMLRVINILLENKDENSLECLCTLLTTVGKDLELSKNQNLNSYFQIMQEVVEKKHGKISSRVRFMLQDVIDLRNSKWVPRRQDLNLKTDIKGENERRLVRLGANQTQTDDDVKTAELYTKVRGVLNKLSSEKFETLLHQIRALSIDNEERLQGVIDLVFEKAVNEPNVSVVCARMCKEIALMQVSTNTRSNNNDNNECSGLKN